MSMMGELNYFLGLQIKQTSKGMFIHQSNYIRNMLAKFEFDNLKSCASPMAAITKLNKDEQGESVEEKKYRGMIGSLLYLTASRPNILFSICMCARFQANPKASHLTAVKRIFCCLSGTTKLGLRYPSHD
ncbi:Retrovirus-related Pol polyprotein from transposon RE1 [Linum perenne]